MLCGIVAPVVACTVPNPDFCNETDRQTCEVGYSCDLSLNRCVPTPDAAVHDAAIEDAATVDAATPDAASPDASLTAWDIAFVDQYSTTDSYNISAVTRIVNTGPVALDLAGLEVVSVEHDAPAGVDFNTQLATTPLNGSVPPGSAFGMIVTEPLFAPLISEPIADDTVDLLRFSAAGLMLDDPPIHATVVIRLAGLDATLEVTTNAFTSFTSTDSAARVSAVAP